MPALNCVFPQAHKLVMTSAKELTKDLALKTGISAISLLAGLAGSTAIEIGGLAADKLLPWLSKPLLIQLWLLTTLVLLPSCLVFLVLWWRTRNRLYAFGVNWNKKGVPRCPACDAPMHLHSRNGDHEDMLRCPKCEAAIWLISDEREPLLLAQAKSRALGMWR